MMGNQELKQEEDFSDLFVDRNLFAVFRSSPTIFANRFNGIITTATFSMLLLFCATRFTRGTSNGPPAFVSTFALWATVGWTVSSTLLGFLIAGFALLCTVLRPSAVVALHQYYGEGETQNRLRSLFVFFVDIFISYLSLLVFSLAMVIVTSPNGPSIDLRLLIARLGPEWPQLVGYAIYLFWGTWFIVLALKLKTFVYNLYQALMIGMTESVHSATECANMVTDHQITASPTRTGV